MQSVSPPSTPAPGLGIDAGGTRTRWALADAAGSILAEGEVAGLSALQMASAEGRASLHASVEQMALQVRQHAAPLRIRAGLTGFGADGAPLRELIAGAFGLAPDAVTLSNDIEIAYLDSFAPGEGYLVYAGTGSIGAYIDIAGQFHRAGGRGVLLDDGGGGYWIARAGLRHIWRAEDEAPGSWRTSPMAQAVFTQLGGDDWDRSRQFMYGQERGAIGQLALAVAASAESDPVAAAILTDAGRELARLGHALCQRFGVRPVALAGRAAALHTSIFASMRTALPDAISLVHSGGHAHHAAARIAASLAP
ncbi:MAG TPA: BadF/BadG/BcrA/BcrD ATPase family protein [Telluria sp.]|jgi:N-acetylglucosamine kinase-like BadF-type ATPase